MRRKSGTGGNLPAPPRAGKIRRGPPQRRFVRRSKTTSSATIM